MAKKNRGALQKKVNHLTQKLRQVGEVISSMLKSPEPAPIPVAADRNGRGGVVRRSIPR